MADGRASHEVADLLMKMRQEHYDALLAAFKLVFARHYSLIKQYRAQGMSELRLRWDILHASGFDTRPLYVYLSDATIDTAMRRAMREAESEYDVV